MKFTTLWLCAVALVAAASHAVAQPADPPACGPYRAKWESVAKGGDAAAMDGVIKVIPSLCSALADSAKARRASVASASLAPQVAALRAAIKATPEVSQRLIERYSLAVFVEAARQGDAVAANLAGKKIWSDSVNAKGAIPYFRQACLGGIASACHEGKQMMLNAYGFRDGAREAQPLMEHGCELESGWACHDAGQVLLVDGYGLKNVAKGLSLLERGCAIEPDGYAACFRLGESYAKGTNGVSRDDQRSRSYYQSGCKILTSLNQYTCKQMGFAK